MMPLRRNQNYSYSVFKILCRSHVFLVSRVVIGNFRTKKGTKYQGKKSIPNFRQKKNEYVSYGI